MTAAQRWIQDARKVLSSVQLSDPKVTGTQARNIGHLLARVGRLPKVSLRPRTAK